VQEPTDFNFVFYSPWLSLLFRPYKHLLTARQTIALISLSHQFCFVRTTDKLK
jgi:hypothetical protein